MIINTIWTANALRNFNYLIVCEETGEALAIDPLDHAKCLSVCRSNGWNITHILNTHEHWDHIGGNNPIVAHTGAKILAHHGAKNSIPGVDRGLMAGDTVRIGKTIELEVLDTPGHTMSHVCVIVHGDRSALFSGDTLFNAGAGNCHNGGDPATLYDTFARQIHTLNPKMRIYPGHDYLVNNLKFTLDREPGNTAAQAMLKTAATINPENPPVLTIAEEQQINTFFRLEETEIVERLQEQFTDLPPQPDPKAVFLKLRELRNHW